MSTHQQAPNVNQVNTSILGVGSATITSLLGTIITVAVKSNLLVDKTFNVAINGVTAAEHISEAAEKRAKIYGEGIVANGTLAERETILKSQLRLHALEKQEKAARATIKPIKAKPATTRKKKVASKKAA